MFEPHSRYAKLPTGVHIDAQGREIVYVTRRFLPRTDRMFVNGRVAVRAGDRLDLVAARALGSAEAWWRLCDATPTLHPEDLELPGSELLVATEAP
ncbi:MAG: hypothetical protein ACE37F_19530 [Nannocystaceae bacterium]|nr:hypothetical protein [bacterium]